MENELESLVEFSQEKPLEYSINPICQDLLKSDKKASEKVTEMVNIFLLSYPDFIPPDDEAFMQHPSYLALYRPIRYWFFTQCVEYVDLWTLMLAAAKEWFPDRAKTKSGHAFCVRFEIEECTWWDGWEPIQPVLKDYLKWRYGR